MTGMKEKSIIPSIDGSTDGLHTQEMTKALLSRENRQAMPAVWQRFGNSSHSSSPAVVHASGGGPHMWFSVIPVFTSIVLAILIAGFLNHVTVRKFMHRFSRLSSCVDQWSRGDFSSYIQDASSDEIGQVACRLNRMAGQLQNQQRTRQELATLEERNRLVRELHDNVKQNIFALSIQISIARELLNRDVTKARLQFDNIEEQIVVSQQALNAAIRELRPVTLESKGLLMDLRDSLQCRENSPESSPPRLSMVSRVLPDILKKL